MMKKYSAKVEVELNVINYTLKNQGEQAQLMTPMDHMGGLLGTGQRAHMSSENVRLTSLTALTLSKI